MRTDFYYESQCGSQIHGCCWAPDGEVKAIVQLVHGISERLDRYQELAEYLNTQGILVVGEDHMGHGLSVTEKTPRCYFAGGWFGAVADTYRLTQDTMAKYPGVPYFIYGHSMGSFMTRTLLAKYPDSGISGAIICGTGWQQTALIVAAKGLSNLICKIKGETHPSKFLRKLAFGSYNDKIKPLLKTATASFGITALNELQELYNGKSLVEDGEFAIDTLKHINEKIAEFKKADGNLYAIYGTPAESLCGLQVTQFRKKFGVVEHVSDRPYVSNSFHCHVTEDITPIEKQDLEKRFWDLSNGGKIQYVKYPIDYNLDAIRTLVRRAMKMGFYEGVNLSLAYCDDCGHQELEMDVCPKCGSSNLTKIDRMNGYLSYSRVKGDSRLNDAKMAEIAERKSM